MPVTDGEPAVLGAKPDPLSSADRLLRDLRTTPAGLSGREAERRLVASGENVLSRHRRMGWPAELARQVIHPLALLLWAAAALAWANAAPALALAIVVVVAINAAFAFVQEQHAERAVEALSNYLPHQARALRDGVLQVVDARLLVPGDVVVVGEGERVSADARILSGSVEVDLSTLTGESQPVLRTPTGGHDMPLLEATDVLFSGTSCVSGEVTTVVFATGMATELGRIAALAQRTHHDRSPLEQQVVQVARLIGLVAVGTGLAFIPIGTLLAGMSMGDTLQFAIGLLVANVPEGLLPTITLALGVGVRLLAREGALVKRLSAVETLGSTDVICTDKTGTLTLNRMRVTGVWTAEGTIPIDPNEGDTPDDRLVHAAGAVSRLAAHALACTTATWDPADPRAVQGDPTEVALVRLAAQAGSTSSLPDGDIVRFPFESALRRMSTVRRIGGSRMVSTKGAPEEVMARCTSVAVGATDAPLDEAVRSTAEHQISEWAQRGLRVLAVAARDIGPCDLDGTPRDEVERDLTLLGVVAMADPPRPEVPAAVDACHSAGIRIIVITGDHGLTARAIARAVGIGDASTPVIAGDRLEAMSEDELDTLLQGRRELIFARSSPEAKLRITDALRSAGHVVAVTGDGVNDAPALRRADIGVAMGRSGTEVAREAATMVLTDDNFATIIAAVRAGRQVYDNVRKFIVYIFAHATPEVVPFLAYALSGGRLPLPLTVMQILAIDLGTETLPALALGREPAEPGIMTMAPRRRTAGVIDRAMLWRAWGLLGGVSALLVTSLYILTLLAGGWRPGDDVTSGPLGEVWRQGTTMTFLAIVACQVGTALAARTHHSSLRAVGLFTNPLLWWGILVEAVFAAALVALPPAQEVFGTAVPTAWQLAALLPLPFAVWGADEVWRWARRHGSSAAGLRAGQSLRDNT